MYPGPLVRHIEEPLFQPVRDRDGVEGQDHLQVVGKDRPQADVQLVEVSFLQLRRLLDPDPGDVVDGFQLFYIVQTREQNLATVGEPDPQVALVDLGAGIRVILGDLPAELRKTAVPQRPRHLPRHQPAVSRFAGDALQDLPAGKDALPAAAAAFENQVAVLVEEQGEEGLVVGLPQALPPHGGAQIPLNLLLPVHPLPPG